MFIFEINGLKLNYAQTLSTWMEFTLDLMLYWCFNVFATKALVLIAMMRFSFSVIVLEIQGYVATFSCVSEVLLDVYPYLYDHFLFMISLSPCRKTVRRQAR